MKHKLIQVMAYLYMPLLFTISGYLVIYIASVPVLSMLQATGSMMIAKEAPDFNKELKSIYDPTLRKEAEVLSQVAVGVADQEKECEVPREEAGEVPIEEAGADSVLSIKNIRFPEHGTHFANLSCERIDLNAPIYWGDTKEILKVGVGQYMGSFLPGFSRTILLSGHNTTFFKSLQLIEVGDVLLYNTNYGEFQYKVTEIQVLSADDAKGMQEKMLSKKREELIMYTCYPFETLVGSKKDRLFVFADKISGPTVE